MRRASDFTTGLEGSEDPGQSSEYSQHGLSRNRHQLAPHSPSMHGKAVCTICRRKVDMEASPPKKHMIQHRFQSHFSIGLSSHSPTLLCIFLLHIKSPDGPKSSSFSSKEKPNPQAIRAACEALGTLLTSEVKYAVLGGAACQLLGSGRVTEDVDFVVTKGEVKSASYYKPCLASLPEVAPALTTSLNISCCRAWRLKALLPICLLLHPPRFLVLPLSL